MSIDKYMNRRFNASNYNCAHFVCEVWEDLHHNKELTNALRGFLCRPEERCSKLSDMRRLRLIRRPVDPCVVLMQSPRRQPHVGIWIRGKVLHLLKEGGVQYQPLSVAALGFERVRFLTC